MPASQWRDRFCDRKRTHHARKVLDYCLKAEGITFDDIDLVVRNCYILPQRLAYQDMPGFLPNHEHQAAKHFLFLSTSDKVVTISHHLAHAYSAFAVCPFDNGVVMVVDGVGSYRYRGGQPPRSRARELL
jgi:carbamoyltransferase